MDDRDFADMETEDFEREQDDLRAKLPADASLSEPQEILGECDYRLEGPHKKTPECKNWKAAPTAAGSEEPTSQPRCRNCGQFKAMHEGWRWCVGDPWEDHKKFFIPGDEPEATQDSPNKPLDTQELPPLGMTIITREDVRRALGIRERQLREARARLSQLEKENQWISVEQELPTEREQVMISTAIAGIMLSSWFCWFPEKGDPPLWHNVLREFGEVTHWRPLPSPPREALSSGSERNSR